MSALESLCRHVCPICGGCEICCLRLRCHERCHEENVDECMIIREAPTCDGGWNDQP